MPTLPAPRMMKIQPAVPCFYDETRRVETEKPLGGFPALCPHGTGRGSMAPGARLILFSRQTWTFPTDGCTIPDSFGM